MSGAAQCGKAREGSDVEKDLVAVQRACSSTVERDLEGPLGDEAASSHHEFAIAGGEPVQMRLDQAFDHRPFARLDLPHRHPACGTASDRLARGDNMSDARSVDEVLARQAGDIGAGTAHIALLYDDDALAGTAEVPRDRFSRLAAAEHYGIVGINGRHVQSLRNSFAGNEPAQNLALVNPCGSMTNSRATPRSDDWKFLRAELRIDVRNTNAGHIGGFHDGGRG